MVNNGITISQFQQLITNAVNKEIGLKNVWVQAEFSDLRMAGGHCYMELLEKDAAGSTRAKIRAMIWAGTLNSIRKKFYEATGRDIASGMKVLVKGSATHHVLYGLSFTISDIDPSYTLGDMERLRREILDKLTREGIINCNKQLEVPLSAQRIAVISAEGAAGYGDFLNQINHNSDGFVIYTKLFPAVMQGERTASSVLHALDLVEMTIDLWDAVVIIRGGGATTDLNGFDNYDIARRVATFPLPVIVGIGHERDRTVLDEIACIRCKTPTAVAAYIVDNLRNAWAAANSLMTDIAHYCSEAIKGEQLRLANISQAIPSLAQTSILREKMKLTEISANIPTLVQGRVLKQQMALADYAAKAERLVAYRINSENANIQRLALRLENACSKNSEHEKLRLKRFDDMIRLLSPVNTLRRGYSITRVAGKAVTDPTAIPPGTIIETTLANGKITSVSK